MWDVIDELWIQTLIATTFRYNILCMLTRISRKLQLICRHSTYQMTAILLEMSIFCVRAGCKIQIVSYASKHASQSLSNKPFLLIQCNLKISGRMWAFSISNDCYIIRGILCVLRVAHVPVVLWYNIVCICCKPIYTSLFGTQLRLTTKLTYLIVHSIGHTKQRLYCQWYIIF